ncbi:MAG TPA: BMP family ABC transporter substrate-binding protein [Marinagarivorans sp.]|nr:BMP family ABC transporter substrate-binding protein [Cellvibrionaceae bacterium]HMY38839.1 BMP family ABC transporter substrate-binding protein [Marinagarivorans sp.]HNG61320.1 BMP family ABC transporter substrate-binding protein [Cellvibrionaceae bacterium]
MTNLINEVCEEEPTAAQKNALPPLRRRDFVRLSALGAAAYAGVKAPPLFAADKDKVVMGFIYVGPRDDYGYNQAHFEGKTALAKLDWVKAVDEERVPETIEVQKTMDSMINLSGAQVLFPTSFGYFDPHILKYAKKYPKVMFLHCGGLWDEAKHPKNVGSYFGYIDEAVYISGLVAGHMSKTGKLGFIAAMPIPQVLRNINSFTLAARSVNPKITTSVVFTGGWSNPVKEAEAANSLIDQGVDVLTCHVDSPKVVVETAEKRGIFSCGYHTNNAALAPKGFLTGAEWNWSQLYLDYAALLKEGKPIPNLMRGGIKEGIVKVSPYGKVVSDAAKAAADAKIKQFMQGDFVVYQGPIKDNTGKEVIPAGKSYGQKDIALESMDWLVEGVVGSAKS